MGKASRWFRSLLGSKKSSTPQPPKEKKKGKWVLPKLTGDNRFRNEDPLASPYIDGLDANKHAIAVAAATAAVAEAALAAAHAAAEVVRLTSGGGNGSGRNVAAYISSERGRVSAAIKIQSAFRAYLARRALRALKALVKLQALVRGHIVRKQSADVLRRMQAMVRIQARASAQRSDISSSSSNISSNPGVILPRKYDPQMSNPNSKHRESVLKLQMASNRITDERADKILEIDTWKPRQQTRTMQLPRFPSTFGDVGQDYSKTRQHSAKSHKPNPSISSEEVSSVISPNFPTEGDQPHPWTAESSPKVHSASSSRQTSNWPRPPSPARSQCTRSLVGDYLSHPNYMANTQSSRAKVRSLSVPKQRLQQLETVYGRSMWDNDCLSEKGFALTANHGDIYLNSGYMKRQSSRTYGATNGVGSNYGFRI